MIDIILFVTASTLSGSLLLLLIETAGRFIETKIGPGKIYLLLKISLLYFWIPIVFLALFLAGMYTYEPNLMPHEELDGFYTLNYFTDLAMERQFVRTPPWIQSLFGIWIAGAVSIGAGRSLYKRVQLHRLLENCTRLEGGRVMEAARSAALHVSIRKGISLYGFTGLIRSFTGFPICFGITGNTAIRKGETWRICPSFGKACKRIRVIISRQGIRV